MSANKPASNEDVLTGLDQLLSDTRCRIRHAHQLMDNVYQRLGDGNADTGNSVEGGWRLAI